MYSKKGVNNAVPNSPSDAQAKEKLAVYVYEYLMHIGAQKSAQTFLEEMRWEKAIRIGEPPGFLQAWWNVFWDLYSAAPERREHNEHSSEARAFHDYGMVNSGYPAINGIGQNATPSPLGGMPPGQGPPGAGPPPDGLPPGPGGPPHPFFPGGPGLPNSLRPSPPHQSVSQPSPHSMMSQQQFMAATRYPSPRPPLRLPQDHQTPPFSSTPGGGYPPSCPGPPVSLVPLHARLPPSASGPPNGAGNGALPIASGPGGPHSRCLPPLNHMQYSEPSPGQYSVGGPPLIAVSNGPQPCGPGTPISPSPQSMPDTSCSESMYLMKAPSVGNMSSFPPGAGGSMTSSDGGGGPGGGGGLCSGDIMMNGDASGSCGGGQGGNTDIKTSPHSGTPGPGSVGPPSGDPNGPSGQDYMSNFQPHDGVRDPSNESEAIMRIKETLGEEAKRFEKPETPGGTGGNGSAEFTYMS